MMPTAGPPPTEFFIAAIALSFIVGALFAYVYDIAGKSLAGKNATDKGFRYGLILFIIGTLPGMVMLFLLINLPLALIMMWTAEGFIVSLVSGIAIAMLVK